MPFDAGPAIGYEHQSTEFGRSTLTCPLLIIDDFGLKPMKPPHDEDFHDLISERYERAATIVTSNLDFSEWGDAFPNRLLGAARDGRKELLAIEDGNRESKLSWQSVLTDLKRRGLKEAPALAIGDGGLGFWAALEEVFPQTHHQRCWVHKSANVLDNLPKTIQAQAKARLHQMYLSPTRQDAQDAYEDFLSLYDAKYPKACACLEKDKDVLFTFYDFPAAHW